MNEISEKVLFVDDEVNFLEGVRRQLRRSFDITTAVGGQEGLAILQREGPFAVVISDYNMPNMDGVEFLKEVHAASPETVSPCNNVAFERSGESLTKRSNAPPTLRLTSRLSEL